MTEDPTLTDFIEEGGGDDSAEPDSTESVETSSDERGAVEAEAVSEDETGTGTDGEDSVVDAEPATTTYAWGSYVCGVCGSSVERVWKRGTEDDGEGDDGEANGTATDLVCESCKVW